VKPAGSDPVLIHNKLSCSVNSVETFCHFSFARYFVVKHSEERQLQVAWTHFLRARFCTAHIDHNEGICWQDLLANQLLSVIKICFLSGTEGSGLKCRSAKDWLSGQNTSTRTMLCFCLVIT